MSRAKRQFRKTARRNVRLGNCIFLVSLRRIEIASECVCNALERNLWYSPKSTRDNLVTVFCREDIYIDTVLYRCDAKMSN